MFILIHFPDHLRDSDALLTFISIETHIKNHNLNILVEIGIFMISEMLILSERQQYQIPKHKTSKTSFQK